MITEHIAYTRACELIERAIDERGEDYVHVPPGALHSYFEWNLDADRAEPGCLIGLALSYIGLAYEDIEPECNTGTNVRDLLDKLGVSYDPAAAELLVEVQENQDGQLPWDVAYARAKNEEA